MNSLAAAVSSLAVLSGPSLPSDRARMPDKSGVPPSKAAANCDAELFRIGMM